MVKRFYIAGRDRGTLQNFKSLLNRTNVNGLVKGKFQAHEDFIHTVGEGLLLQFCMGKLRMEDTNDKPTLPGLPANINRTHLKTRKPLFQQVVGQIVDALFTPFRENEEPRQFQYRFDLGNGQQRNFAIPAAQFGAKDSVTVRIPEINQEVSIENPDTRDRLQNYNLQFLQWYLHLLEFQDGIREGDPFRTNINLKRMIPFFYSHSKASNYAVECIDYILKTEVLLPEALALRTRLGSFVNPHGIPGGNKAADMQQENNILVLKDIIRGLGAGKTPKALGRASLAAPVMRDIVENYKSVLNVHTRQGRHRKKKNSDDVLAVLRVAKEQRLFDIVPGRGPQRLHNFRRDPFHFIQRHGKDGFRDHLDLITKRLQRGLDVEEHDESDDEEVDELH